MVKNEKLQASLRMQIENLVDELISEELSDSERFILSYALWRLHNFYLTEFLGLPLSKVKVDSTRWCILDICKTSTIINGRNKALYDKSVSISEDLIELNKERFYSCLKRPMKDANGYGSLLQFIATADMYVYGYTLTNNTWLPERKVLNSFLSPNCDFDELLKTFKSYLPLHNLMYDVDVSNAGKYIENTYSTFKFQVTGDTPFMSSLNSLILKAGENKVDTLVKDMDKLISDYLSQTGVDKDVSNTALITLARKIELEAINED